MRAIVDTNVMQVANRASPQAFAGCVRECIRQLRLLEREGRIVLDEDWHILREYGHQLDRTGQPGVGDAFYKWVLTNHANPARCEKYRLTLTAPDEFREFPADPALAGFDPSDRKFAALAAVSGAPVWNAVDSDWWNWRAALASNGVAVEFLCPDHFPE